MLLGDNTGGRGGHAAGDQVPICWKLDFSWAFMYAHVCMYVCAVCCAGRRSDHDQQHCYHHAPKVKPEAATAVVELLMVSVRTPETC
jgi:hypothetical protein